MSAFPGNGTPDPFGIMILSLMLSAACSVVPVAYAAPATTRSIAAPVNNLRVETVIFAPPVQAVRSWDQDNRIWPYAATLWYSAYSAGATPLCGTSGMR